MKTGTLIIGGGLTGLSLAYRLQEAGHDYQLIEARHRFGGRIKSHSVGGAAFDLGPSWVWAGQTRVAALLADLGLQTFAQWSDGAKLREQANGDIIRNPGFMSMEGAFRIAGGTSALTDALVAKLDPARLHSGTEAIQVTQGAQVTCADGKRFAAERVVVAIPPRVAARTGFSPPLGDAVARVLGSVPTWMAAHARFVAVYPRPFWRDTGLSGDASSGRGPLVEIHDASPADSDLGALFGFVGVPADMRADAGATAIVAAAVKQLGHLFGPDATRPVATHLQDWSAARFTATPADAIPPPGHPPYGMPDTLRAIWNGTLIFAVTELARDNGGLIEGALAASQDTASQILGT